MEERAIVEAIVEAILKSGDGDWVGLWELVHAAEALMPNASDDEKRHFALAGLERVLDLGYAEIGDLRSPDDWVRTVQGVIRRQHLPRPSFEPWHLSNREVVARVESEWIATGHAPNIGDICWLELTREGMAAAKKLNDT
jgi:hypothetical protein